MAALLSTIVIMFLACHSTKIIVNFYEAIQVGTSFLGVFKLLIFYHTKMPKIDTLDALEEHEEHEDDYQTNSN